MYAKKRPMTRIIKIQSSRRHRNYFFSFCISNNVGIISRYISYGSNLRIADRKLRTPNDRVENQLYLVEPLDRQSIYPISFLAVTSQVIKLSSASGADPARVLLITRHFIDKSVKVAYIAPIVAAIETYRLAKQCHQKCNC